MDESWVSSSSYGDCVDANGTEGEIGASDGGSSAGAGRCPLPGEAGMGLGHVLVVWLVYGPIILVTIAGNFLAMMAFARDPAIRRRTANCFIFSLCVADFLVGWTMIFNFVWLLEDVWVLGEWPCLLYLSMDYALSYASVLAIVLISLDRYRLVTLKLRYVLVQTRRRAVVSCCACWAFCLTFYPLTVVGWAPLTGRRVVDYSWDCDVESRDDRFFNLLLILMEFVLPLAALIYLNGRLYLTIRRRARGLLVCGERQLVSSVSSDVSQAVSISTAGDPASGVFYLDKSRPAMVSLTAVTLMALTNIDGSSSVTPGLPPPEIGAPARPKPAPPSRSTPPPQLLLPGTGRSRRQSIILRRRQFRKHRKAAVTLSLLVGVYIVCWLPFYVKNTALAFCDDCVGYYVAEVTDNLLWCNSTVNPFLYALLNLRYRRYIVNALRRVFCCFN